MTNDTNTLNGSLRQLGETMASNLTTQGVPSTYDEGLTTLAGKILQITPPTPVPTTLKTYINGVEVDNTQELPANIISYADSEYIDYKFVVLDANNNPVQGYSIPLSGGGSAVSPTPVTDSNGEVSYRYVSGGVGDTNVSINCTLVSKTYSLEDCRDYQPLTSNAHESRWTIPSGVTSSYSDNGWRISANGYKQVKLTDKLTTACSVEFTISDYSNVDTQAVIVFAYTNGETTPNLAILQGGTSASNLRKVFTTQLDHDLIKGGKYRIEYTTSTIKVYENNALLGESINTIGFPTRFEWHMGVNGRYAIYKDLKVKPL